MRHALKLLLAAAVSLLVLGLLFRLVEGDGEITRERLLEIARQLAWGWLALGVAGTLLQALIRARRYALLLRAGGEPAVPPPGHMLLVTMTRNMFVDLLPARLGELSYVALLNRGFQLRLETCLSSLSLSVLFDFAALLVLVAGLAVFYAVTGKAAGWMAGASIVLVLVLAVGLFALFCGPALAASLVARLPLGRLGAGIARLLQKLDEAFTLTRRAGVLGAALGLSLLVRVAKYGGFYALFRAVTQNSFPDFAAASPPQVVGALLSAEGASSVPVPSFMSFGAYEAGGAAAWTALGFPAAAAAVCMFAIHVVSQVIDYGLGGTALLVLLGRRTEAAARRASARGWAVAAAALAAGAALFVGWSVHAARKQGARSPPPPGEAVTPPAAVNPAALPHGRLVWSSNRSGNHDIWTMQLPDMRAERLTRHPHTEYHPRLSPDGAQIVFARSLKPWVSQRNELEWQVVLLDLASGEERVLAEHATAPSWSAPGVVVFQSAGTGVVEQELATGSNRVLCAAGDGVIPPECFTQTPSYRRGASGVAVTLRGGARGTGLAAADGWRRVAGGCQLGWDPSGRFLLMTDKGGRMKNMFHRVDPVTMAREAFFDAPEPWSHEYFPALSPDGRWLVYAACAQGHEHDTADYEIFIWRVGGAAETAARLTWHTGNDAWPDLWVAPQP